MFGCPSYTGLALYSAGRPLLDSQEKRFLENVLAFIRQHGLVPVGGTLVVGVSGGPDSVCLLHLLVRLQDRLDGSLHAAHLNHMLRGTESDDDAEYVAKMANDLGIGITAERRDVRSYRAQHHLSLEDAARRVRYQFFAEVAEKMGTDRVAVGHTADDQVETILMRLVRGTGAKGLQGMHPVTELRFLGTSTLTVIRPLLRVTRKEIEAYCRHHGLTPRADSSNLLPSHLRNRIRHELVPLLRSYNPKIDEALLRTADTLTSELSFVEDHVSRLWHEVVAEDEGAFLLDKRRFAMLHPALQRHLLRDVVKRLLGSLEDVEWKHIEKMRISFTLSRGKRVILPRRLMLYVEKEKCRLAAD
jgi:tRNA(Ile)-lysidine synthase